MARNDSDNFYRRQQEEANRIAAKQHRVLTDIAKLAKSSNEELRKFRKAFEAFAEAILGMKIEPFQGAVLSEAAREQVAEFDIKGFRETLLKGGALVVPGDPVEMASDPGLDGPSYGEPESMPYPKVDIAPKGKPKTKAARFGYGDVMASMDDPDERTAPSLAVVDEAEADTLDSAIKAALNDDGDPLPLDRDAMFACPSDCALDHEHIAAHGSDPAFWHEPEEECADVSEARRTPQGFASGGYTGVGLSENVMSGIVHQGIFSDTTVPEKNTRALSQYAANAERQRRDGLASY